MLTDIANSHLWDINAARYKITDAGLEITVDKKTQDILKELQQLEEKGEPLGFHTDELFIEVIEWCLCNGLSTVAPEDIGALTDSIILSEFSIPEDMDTYESFAVFYWYPNYQIRSPIEDLAEHGKVIFTKAA